MVVVTGASGGIGRATARAFAARGAHVALLARGEVGLQAAASDVQAAGGKAMVVPVDVADADQVEESAAAVESGWARSTCGSMSRSPRCSPRSPRSAPMSTGGSPRSVTSATCTPPWPRCVACARVTPAPSCRSARRWRTGAFRCRRRTAVPNTPFRDFTRRCVASCCTRTAMCT